MRRLALAALLAMAMTGNAAADGIADFEAAVLARQNGKIGEAIQLYTRALAAPELSAVNRATIYVNRGIIFEQTGAYDRAIADYDMAVKLRPDYAAAFNNRGNAYDDKGDAEHAIADYDMAIKLGPNLAIAYFNRGNALRHQGEVDRAIADYDRAIALEPEDPDTYVNRGNAFEDKEAHERAIADYDRALRLAPDRVAAYLDRGTAYLRLDRFDRALADYSQAMRLKPSPETFFARGAAHFLRADFAQAQRDFTQSAKGERIDGDLVLWLHLARAWSGAAGPNDLPAQAGAVARDRWPGAIVGFYLRQVSPDALRQAAATGDAATQAVQRCQAEFHIGEYAALIQHRDAARDALTAAAERCPPRLVERKAAEAEIRRLGLSTAGSSDGPAAPTRLGGAPIGR